MYKGLPVTKDEATPFAGQDIETKYDTLTPAQQKAWVSAATASNGCIDFDKIRNTELIEIFVWDPVTKAYARYHWTTANPF